MKRSLVPALGFLLLGLLGLPGTALSHCDTLDGPVVSDAREALEKGDVTPVLKWIHPKDEETVAAAFQRTLHVRALEAEAQALADLYFFETVVRIHREAEGAPYTGLKPEGAVEPGIELADAALASGSADRLLQAVTDHVRQGIAGRFDRVHVARSRADESVEAGREYVQAYVDYIHYVEGIHQATAAGGHHASPEHQDH